MDRAAARQAEALARIAGLSVQTVTVKPDPEADRKYREWKRERNIKDALRAQDPMASKRTNESLHVVDTPGGVAAYHKERQRSALEIAKTLKGKDRKFALKLAKEHAQAKRSFSSNQQPRVPAGVPTGGQWAKR